MYIKFEVNLFWVLLFIDHVINYGYDSAERRQNEIKLLK